MSLLFPYAHVLKSKKARSRALS